ncbi:MAG: hypothetical protein U0031_05395 [Thermomicrobiales bacterium]
MTTAIELTDLSPSFLQFWEQAAALPRDVQRHLWYHLYEDRYRAYFVAGDGRHGNSEALPAALDRFADAATRIPEAAQRVRSAINAAAPELARIFDLAALDLSWVLLVGMYWSDGWVAKFAGKQTCFIALEMIGDASGRAEILTAHEGAHVAHSASLGASWDDLDTLGDALFVEGLATLASARVAPGFDPATYLWAAVEPTVLRGLSHRDWIAQCEAAWPDLRCTLLRDLATRDATLIDPLFLGSSAPFAQPERIGYFAAYRLVSELAKSHSIATLARWRSRRIRRELAVLLSNAIDGEVPLTPEGAPGESGE